MAKYRKKPVVIEAVQIPDSEDMVKWGELAVFLGAGGPWIVNDQKGIDIKTLEGTMTGNIGDFIIKGVNGEYYPCKPDIFEKTYEPVER